MLGAGLAEDFFFQVGDACVELGVLHVPELRLDRGDLFADADDVALQLAPPSVMSSLVAMCLTTCASISPISMSVVSFAMRESIAHAALPTLRR